MESIEEHILTHVGRCHDAFRATQFAHFSAIVGSRAMVFKGQKFLAPLADMMNYGPRFDEREDENGLSFLDYHDINEEGYLTVKVRQ